MTFFKGFCLCLVIGVINGIPQGNDQQLNDRIQDIFGSLSQPTNTGNRGGFGEIVQPEPENLAPTQQPQTFQNNGQSCKCVPYWNCQPDNNPTPATTTTDSRFFGEIDVR